MLVTSITRLWKAAVRNVIFHDFHSKLQNQKGEFLFNTFSYCFVTLTTEIKLHYKPIHFFCHLSFYNLTIQIYPLEKDGKKIDYLGEGKGKEEAFSLKRRIVLEKINT